MGFSAFCLWGSTVLRSSVNARNLMYFYTHRGGFCPLVGANLGGERRRLESGKSLRLGFAAAIGAAPLPTHTSVWPCDVSKLVLFLWLGFDAITSRFVTIHFLQR